MTRTEIINAAKSLVAHHGPFNVLEFGDELLAGSTARDDPRWVHRGAILTESCKQAERVLNFLGL